jgi:hypothetical protein
MACLLVEAVEGFSLEQTILKLKFYVNTWRQKKWRKAFSAGGWHKRRQRPARQDAGRDLAVCSRERRKQGVLLALGRQGRPILAFPKTPPGLRGRRSLRAGPRLPEGKPA